MENSYLTCLMFGEGRGDKKFLSALIKLKKFKYYTKKWSITLENASGCAPKVILRQCQEATLGKEYSLVMCFVDLDVLKKNYPKTWEAEKQDLENTYSGITIVWQINNAEEEYKKVLGNMQPRNKHKANKLAQKEVEKFINSSFWARILEPIIEAEKKADQE